MTNGRLSQLLLIVAFVASASSMAGPCRAAELTADFYVSPNGADTWSGTLSAPNDQQSDGPFATLERARDAVRESEKARSQGVVVLIRGAG